MAGEDLSAEGTVIDNRRRKGRNSSMRDQVKKRAIVTGASSGIGREISRMLVEMGYEVYGFGRSFSDEEPDQIDTKRDLTGKICTENGTDAQNEEKGMLHRIVCDLLDTQELERQIKQIRRQGGVQLLVNNAGVGYYGLHEELNTQKIQKLVRTNLEVPMVLTNLLLRDLKKCAGTIINISSVTAQLNNPHGCAYGATKAGLSSFSRSLFDEVRKYFLQFCKNIFNIDKYHQVARRIHSLQITIFAIINTVHYTGGIIEIFIAKALADRRSLIDQPSLLGGNDQHRMLLLTCNILSFPTENVLIMVDRYLHCLRKFLENFACSRMFCHRLLHIYMGKCFIIIISV